MVLDWIVLEADYTILRDVHEKTDHDGRDKMRVEVKQHYYWIPSKVISIYLSTCVAWQITKPVKNHVVSTAIVSFGFLTRFQIDLIDLRTRPDGEFKRKPGSSTILGEISKFYWCIKDLDVNALELNFDLTQGYL
ncbi:unnamed protein product [Didymodactylos carnosus]|uniref:Integrase zinc-binding domain-containing protein n=1 Tax=Didymodactylos carnosus TaxID=1234261 RepID=A0A815QIS5_9BILA|nr:unnamed protein product [Didymodactylos carnosus]CAF4333239.1 unnamed protein product [Didymodactylos carnosus]